MSDLGTPAPTKSLVLSLAKGFRILEVFDGQEPELTLSQIAQRAELDSGTALGHSILAYLPFEQRVEILNMQERVKLTPRTPVTIPEIEDRLEQVRRIGYALSDQDTVSGLRVLAAPILDADGHPYAGVSVAA